MVAPLILGVNPLIGVDHLSADRARQSNTRTNSASFLEVVHSAMEAGAQGFTFSPNEKVTRLLKESRDSGEKSSLKLYPLLPALDKYWPVFHSRGAYGLISAVLTDLSWFEKARTLVKGGAIALTSNPLSAIRTYVDIELSKIQSSAPRNWIVDTVFLGESFTDMILSLRSYDLIRVFCESVESREGVKAGLQTLNLSMLLSARKQFGLSHCPPVMAPFNPIGFQMTPDRMTCERAAEAATEVNFVAISVLAAGQIPLSRAVDYLTQKRRYLRSVAVGTSSPNHARETFNALRRAIIS
jgi:hypothetical protein